VSDKIKSYDNVVLYGLGYILKLNIDNYIEWLGKPAFIVDKSIGGTVYNGVSVVSSLSDVCERIEGTFCVVITAPSYYEEISIECKKYIPEDAIFKYFLPSSHSYRSFVKEQEKEIETFYFSLADEISKITLENYLSGKITGDWRYFAKVCVPNRAVNPSQLSAAEIDYPPLFDSEQSPYFPKDIFTLPKDVFFIDCGAYDGDTLTDFMKETNGECTAAICIELSKSNYDTLAETAKKYHNVQCLHAGVWNENTSIEISDAGGPSLSIDASKNESRTTNSTLVPLKKLDDIITDPRLNEYIHIYIKMDLEGAELMALKGAEHTIKTHKPKLAICVYHKDEDIIEIPAYLKSLNPDYSFYLRKYSACQHELVLFAI